MCKAASADCFLAHSLTMSTVSVLGLVAHMLMDRVLTRKTHTTNLLGLLV